MARSLSPRFEHWRAALAALSWRECLLAMLAVTALCYAGLDLWLLTPAQRELDGLKQGLQARRIELQQLAAAIPSPPATGMPQPSRLASELERFTHDLRRADQAVRWHTELQRLLERHPGIRLQHLKIQPPAALFSSAELTTVFADGAEHPPIRSESAEFSLQGSYPALQALLAELEHVAPAAYWSEARLQARHPESTLTLVIRQIFSAPADSR